MEVTMNKDKLSRAFSVTVTVIFILFLFVGMTFTLLNRSETFSFFENRNLAKMPSFTVDGALDGTYFSGVDTFIKEHSAGRLTLLKADTYINMSILKKPVVNDIVITEDVLLPWNDYEIIDKGQINEVADRISEHLKTHSELTESYGGRFYYVAVPNQSYCYAESYPSYMNDGSEYTDYATNALFTRLEGLGVDYIDLGEYFNNEGSVDTFSSTVDHHFSIFGAHEAYVEIMEQINLDTGLDIDILGSDEYESETLTNTFIGSRARKLFGLWNSDEKLSIITPANAPGFDRRDYYSTVDSSVYKLPAENESVLYTMYMGGDVGFTTIDTHREELPTVLIYGDSFTNAVECFAWYSFDKMYSLDFRHYSATTLDEFIEINKPDIVICMRDYSVILREGDNGQ